MTSLTMSQLNALQRYAASNGRTWKSQLANDWMNGHSSGELQVLRNTHGPSWLMRFSLKKALAAIRYDVMGYPTETGQPDPTRCDYEETRFSEGRECFRRCVRPVGHNDMANEPDRRGHSFNNWCLR